MKVIEFNAFNSSGFYAHDIAKIVTAATEHFRNALVPSAPRPRLA